MAPQSNPFKPAEKIEPKVKALVFGGPGIGKTYLALGSPGKVAVIDTEGGTAFYAGRAGLSDFDVLPTKSFADVREAVTFLAAGGHGYSTLVIDPVTILYETLQETALYRRVQINARRRRGATDVDEADLEQLDWGRIKRSYKRLMTELVNLPMHVVVTAREKEETIRGEDGEYRTTGRYKPDAEKGTAYYFDVVMRLVEKGDSRVASVTKDRTGAWPLNSTVADPTFEALFSKVLAQKGKATRKVQDPTEAAAHDAAAEDPTRPTARAIASLMEALEAVGKDPDEVLASLKVTSFAEATAQAVEKLTAKAKAAAAKKDTPAEPAEEAAPAAEVA